MREFWSKQRVLLTGGAGFLGTFVRQRLEAEGCAQIFIPRSKDYNLVEMPAVQRVLADSQPTLILHLAAAVGGIGANQKNPGKFFYDNLMMGVQLMEEARRQNIPKFVALGTICAYPKYTPAPFKEIDLWNGYPEETNAPYGLAKKMLLVQAQAYRQQYGYNAVCLFPVNLYGPCDNFDLETSHVIPALIRKCLEAKAQQQPFIEAWGTGQATREFLYVEDAAEGIVKASEFYNSSEPINLGSGEEISIRDLLSLIMELTGYQGEIHWNNSKSDGQPRRLLDIQKAAQAFGFRAQMSLREGLQRTIAWYQAQGLR